MFTEPKIITSDDLTKRAYITFYLGDERVREYNGKCINQRINPNRATSVIERNLLLKKLQFEIHKALDAGNYPATKTPATNTNEPLTKDRTVNSLLLEALNKKLKSSISKTYKRDLTFIHRDFMSFALPSELEGRLEDITTYRVEEFLSQYGSSGTYYMNKRRNLAILFAIAGRIIDKPIKAVKATERRRVKAKLHVAYDAEQLIPVLDFLKDSYPNLYVCCLLTYGSWLRPHEEIRLLVPSNFKKDNNEIHLSGDENKGGKVRVVYVPDYVRNAVEPMLASLGPELNLFSGEVEPLNESYFNTQWSRAYKKMYAKGLVKRNQTIYSFRHTAAVSVYKRTKDVYLLQKLLGHSSIVVTIKYLRSLGEFDTEQLKDAAPTL